VQQVGIEFCGCKFSPFLQETEADSASETLWF